MARTGGRPGGARRTPVTGAFCRSTTGLSADADPPPECMLWVLGLQDSHVALSPRCTCLTALQRRRESRASCSGDSLAALLWR